MNTHNGVGDGRIKNSASRTPLIHNTDFECNAGDETRSATLQRQQLVVCPTLQIRSRCFRTEEFTFGSWVLMFGLAHLASAHTTTHGQDNQPTVQTEVLDRADPLKRAPLKVPCSHRITCSGTCASAFRAWRPSVEAVTCALKEDAPLAAGEGGCVTSGTVA